MPWKGLGAFVILLLLACGVGYVCGSLSFATLLVPKYTAAAEAHIVSPKYTAGMHDSLTAGMVVPEGGEDSLKPGQWPVIFNHTLGFEGEGWPSDESDSCSSNGDGPIAARRILDAAAASAAAAVQQTTLCCGVQLIFLLPRRMIVGVGTSFTAPHALLWMERRHSALHPRGTMTVAAAQRTTAAATVVTVPMMTR